MKHLLLYSLLVSLVVLCSISCKKGDNHEHITGQTEISVTSPYENQSYRKGDTIFINGKINSPVNIHGYKVLIIKDQTDTLFVHDEHLHSMDVNINQIWVNSLSANATLKLVIVTTLDHDGNTTNKQILFKSLLE